MRHFKKLFIASAAATLLMMTLAASASAATVSVATVNAPLNHRAGAGTNHRVLSTMPQNSLVVLINDGTTAPADWARVQRRDSVGFAHRNWLTVHTDKEVNLGRGVVTGSAVNLRAQPNTTSASQGLLARNTNVDVVGVRGGWYRVRHNGRTGYMFPRYIRLSNVPTTVGGAAATTTATNNNNATTQTTQNRGVITTNNVNFRAQAGLNSSIFQMLARGTIVEVLGRQGDWVNVRFNGRTGFVFHRYIRLTDVANADAVRNEILGTGQTSNMGQAVVNKARQLIGTPYRWGGASPAAGFDCSGLVFYIHGHFGRTLFRTATAQLANGTPVARANMQPGDIVFWRDETRSTTGATHVGIYIGGAQFIHSPRPGQNVRISSMASGYYDRWFLTARRIFN